MLTLNPGPWLWGQALLVAGSGAAVFIGGYAAAGLTAGLAAFIGSWNVMLEQRMPGAHRRRLTPVAGVALVLSAMAGFALSAWHASPWAMIGTGAALTTGCYYLCLTLRAAPPGGFLYLLAYTLCSTVPVTTGQLPALLGWVTAGATAGLLISIMETLAVGRAAEYRAVARAYRSLAALITAAGGEREAARHAAVTDLDAAWEAVRRGVTAGTRRSGEWQHLVDLCQYAATAVAAAGALPRTTHRSTLNTWHAAASDTARRLAQQARRGPLKPTQASVQDSDPVPASRGRALTDATARLHQALADARRSLDTPTPTGHHPVGSARYPSLWAALGAGARGRSYAWRYAMRAGGAVLAAGGLAHLAGLTRPGWSMIAAGSVVLASGSIGTANRAVQRCLGTLLGLGATAAVLALHPAETTVVLLAPILVGLAQPFLAKNSALAMTVLTPGVLPLSYRGTGPYLPMLGDRLLTTALGCAVAVLTVLALWRRPDPVLLRGQLAASIRALTTEASGPHAERIRRRTVLTAVQNTGNAFRQALGDIRPPQAALALWPAFLALQDLGFQLAARPLSSTDRARAAQAMHALAEAAAHGTPPPPGGLPADWATPEARDASRRLRAALGDGLPLPTDDNLIHGQLRNSNGNPLPHIPVTLIDPAGTQADVAYTDSQGRYVLHPARAGRHLLVATTDSTTTPTAHVVLVPRIERPHGKGQ
ncbi:putative membrane protein YccC [Streptomyces sp. DSM 42143]|uniref:FUSC family protein n=1 Tax=Streptomyces sp. DSM 42143 TaxID=2817711 RepID=UPI00278A076F|nr:FUSC family protein [Streptomyces sp. DSM 42143]MDQ0383192.1 putative membrane protein YccC [Streptomyces sp. DSM 42143]